MPDLTVATFNLWGLAEPWRYLVERAEVRGAVPGSPATKMRPSEGVWPRRRRLIVDALTDVRPDLVGLEESEADPADGGRSQAEQLADDLGYRAVVLPSCGLAILSRHPVHGRGEVPFPSADPYAPAGYGAPSALHALVETPSGLIDLLVVHLTPRSRANQRAAAERLLDHLGALPSGRTTVVVGDLNAPPDAEPVRLLTGRLRDAWAVANPDDPGPTMPSHRPTTPRDRPTRFDYLLVGPGPQVVRAWLLGTRPDADGLYASDHLGVAAKLRWSGVEARV